MGELDHGVGVELAVHVSGVDPAAFGKVYTFDWKQGGSDALLTGLQKDQALIEENFSKSHNDLKAGDTFTITSIDGNKAKLTVAGVYKDPVLMTGITISNTAFDQFAARAFRTSAVDYLLKPIDATDLKESVRKAAEMIRLKTGQEQIHNLLHNINKPEEKQRIAFSGRFTLPIAIIVSTRLSASRAVLAWIVVSDPS